MKIGIISDIHSNLEALKTVFNDFNEIDKIICLGDIVGYGPYPDEVVEFLIKNNIIENTIAGNHDFGVAGKIDLNYFNENAKNAILWTRNKMKPENIKVLYNLVEKKIFNNDNFLIVHGSPRNPIEEYITSAYIAMENIRCFSENICFIGHTHYPFVYIYPELGLNYFLPDRSIIISPKFKYIVNCGSVGQPRDRDNRAAYVIFDTEKLSLTLKRVEYDIKKTQKAMEEAKLPFGLIRRLSYGY